MPLSAHLPFLKGQTTLECTHLERRSDEQSIRIRQPVAETVAHGTSLAPLLYTDKTSLSHRHFPGALKETKMMGKVKAT